MISNPNIQISFEYMANTTIANMNHKQLWTSLNQECSEPIGHSNYRDITPWADSGRNINFCDCEHNRKMCRYQKDKSIPIKKLQHMMRQRVKDTLNKYFRDYNFKCGISCYGFGYDLNSELLMEISKISGGDGYSFIPDASLLGNVFIHGISNMLSTAVRFSGTCSK